MKPWPTAVASLALFALSGCGSSNMPELESYMQKVKARPPSPIAPLPAIRPTTTFLYEHQDRRDPFIMDKSIQEVASRPPSGLAPDPMRRKEELEHFALDTLSMVGTLQQDASIWALIKTKDGALHRVAIGNYLGQNNGQVTLISENGIQLTEIVPDGLGDWREQQSAIALSSRLEVKSR